MTSVRWPATFAFAFAAAACNGLQDDARTASEPPPPASRVEIVEPEWPAPGDVDTTALGALPAIARAGVARSPVPALVPRDQPFLATAVVSVGEHFYAFSATSGGINVSIHATRAVHHHPFVEAPPPASRSLRGRPAHVTRNEGIWSASWVEGQVAYNVEAECAHFTDPRCADDGFVVAVTENLAFVGGRRDAPPGGTP